MKGMFLAVCLGMFVNSAAASDKPYYINPDYMVHGVGNATCVQVLNASQSDQNQLDTWADGYINGVNVFSAATPGNVKAKHKLGNIEDGYRMNPLDGRRKFIREWCVRNQSNKYANGVTAWVEHLITTPIKK